MNLLDTHTLIWALNAPEKLSSSARRIIEKGDLVISVVSYWEMVLKKGRRTEIVPDPVPWWRQYIRRSGTKILGIEEHHITHLDTLPAHHSDPFDRILICQCIAEGLRLVTKDKDIRTHYKAIVHCVW